MLERIREGSTGFTAKAILVLVILTFVFAGVGTYTNSVDTSVAVVNGEKISQQQFETAYRNQRARMEQQYGDMFAQLAGNDAYMQSMRSNVLEQLINQELIDQQVAELDIKISDEQIKQTILSMPEFQVDGEFNNDRYLMLINQAGFYDASSFRDYLRTDMARRSLQSGVLATEFSLPYQQQLAAKLNNQTRDIRYATIAVQPFKDSVEVSDEEIDSYYQANKDNFATAEKVKVRYVALDMADLRANVEITDADVESYYQDNKAFYSTNERRRASHILLEFGDDQAAAEQQAEQLLAQINAGEDFAELAKQFSADLFSGENGGDLEWVERGDMDAAFEDALFALTSEQPISSVVESEFGYHIIKLTDIEEVKTKQLAEVADEIRQQLINDQALEKFYTLQGEMATIAFESPDSLEEVAIIANTEVKTSDWLTRAGNAAPFDNQQLIDAAFSEQVTLDALNSDVIEVVSDELVMVLRLDEYQQATIKPLEQVSDVIKAQLVNTKAQQAASEVAEQLFNSVATNGDSSELLVAHNSEFVAVETLVRNAADVDRAIVSKAFTMAHPGDDATSVASTQMSNGDFAVVELTAVNEGEVTDIDERAQQFAVSQLAQSAFESYVANLKEHAEVRRNLESAPAPLY
ncbi:SurA N-terminal domain-containing protein [Thalassotalea ponticola]|uniref:SurA N-terminal domain-containing protein n=1 Tax=Thalassotalea ponticola TaxID=1523392 RepID=UPI0025B2A0E8|nr:SurA N-terminal domain-containing protein [Thalassotalea ponticola]MDN3653894.1 SurA N-terminal domain-containing protein [Thalassotalea ponticola]